MTRPLSRSLVAAAVALAAGGMLMSCTNAGSSSQSGKRIEMVLAPLHTNAPNPPTHPSPYNVYNNQFPRVEADMSVTFHFKAPDAQKVQVALVKPGGTSLDPTPYDMTKGADGIWTYTSAPQTPGYHNYWMIVDGAATLDPNTNAFIGYSHMCNGYEIPEPGVTFYDLKDVPHGNVMIERYYAKSTDQWRHIFVYTPPGYDAHPNAHYPVLYLQHGGGEDERVWTEMGRANTILDNLIAEGRAKPMIIVMETSSVPNPGGAPGGGAPGAAPGGAPSGGPGRGGAPGGAPGAGRGGGFGIGGPGGGAYGRFMTSELIPYIDSHFRTQADRDHRAMAGLSMGGMQTAAVTMNNLDKFSYIGCFSGGMAGGFGGGGRGGPGAPAAAPGAAPATPAPLDLKTIYSGAMADPADFNKKVHVLFFSFGSETPIENPTGLKAHQEQLIKAGITNSYIYISPGTTHEWQTWRRSLYVFAPMLFQD